MTDSKLVTKWLPAYAGNFTRGRSRYGKISEITLHHCAGNITIDALGALWQRVGRRGSSHYGVNHGKVGQYVAEADVAWTNSNWAANCRAVTIEIANSAGAPNWTVADDTLETVCRLVADIAKRNGLGKIVPGKNLTWHSMYVATACPGPYLRGKMQTIADRANFINGTADPVPTPAAGKTYTVRPGDSWWRIAAQQLGSGFKCGELARANGMTTKETIHPGDVLTLPQ